MHSSGTYDAYYRAAIGNRLAMCYRYRPNADVAGALRRAAVRDDGDRAGGRRAAQRRPS